MQALPIVPVDLPAASPSPSPAPKTGEDGLFAARLQAATKQQQTKTSPNATAKAESVSGSKQIASGPDTDQRDTTAAEETPEAILGGTMQMIFLEREFNRLAGFTIEDDKLPEFFKTDKSPYTGSVFDYEPEELLTVYDVLSW